ncbi:MAG: DUF2812 domain-containing protein [Anaerolineales bacterium]
MKQKLVTKFRWFWAWEDEKEETWLADMAGKGLHLESISPFGIYHFQQGEPANIVYRLDFHILKNQDKESYLQLFEDAGWEHVGDLSSWVYFRRPVNGSQFPEIFSDQESKIDKYRRMIVYLAIFLPIMVISIPSIYRTDYFGPAASTILETLGTLLLLLFASAMVMLIRRITQLKKQSEG